MLSAHARLLVRRSLELIRDRSTLNVRILTRSPLARADFDLFKSFGARRSEIKPVTIFHEPINIRAENAERIEAHARAIGLLTLSFSNEERAGVRSRHLVLRTDVFGSRERWQDYAVTALQTVERLAAEVGVADRLHLWPDKSLANVGVANRKPKPREYLRWLRKSWSRISEWPE